MKNFLMAILLSMPSFLMAVPPVPVAISVTSIVNDKATIYWTASSGAVLYGVYENGALFDQTSNNVYYVSNLLQGTQYTFGANAQDSNGGTSLVSVYVTFTAGTTIGQQTQPGTNYTGAVNISNTASGAVQVAGSVTNTVNVNCLSGCSGAPSSAYSGVSIMAQGPTLGVSVTASLPAGNNYLGAVGVSNTVNTISTLNLATTGLAVNISNTPAVTISSQSTGLAVNVSNTVNTSSVINAPATGQTVNVSNTVATTLSVPSTGLTVNVSNTPSVVLSAPVTGQTVNVSNTVAANATLQTGTNYTGAVDISNSASAAVQVSGSITNTVTVGTHAVIINSATTGLAVNVSNTVNTLTTLSLATTGLAVNISNTPSVTLNSATTGLAVSISNTPAVTLNSATTGLAVNISNTPAVTLNSATTGLAVNVSNTAFVALSAPASVTGNIAAAGQSLTITCYGLPAVSYQFTAVGTGATVIGELSQDNGTSWLQVPINYYASAGALPVQAVSQANPLSFTSITFPTNGSGLVRLRASAYTGGTYTINGVATNTQAFNSSYNLPGVSIIGAVGVTNTVNTSTTLNLATTGLAVNISNTPSVTLNSATTGLAVNISNTPAVTISSQSTGLAVNVSNTVTANAILQTGTNYACAVDVSNSATSAVQVAGSITNTVNVQGGTLTKGSQGATGFSTQDLKDSGRVNKTFYAIAAAVPATGVEGQLTLTATTDMGLTTTALSFVITSGKRFRITSFTVATRGNATATLQTTTFSLRVLNTGAATVASTPVIIQARSATPATASAWDRMQAIVPDGLELLGDGTRQFGVTANSTYVTNAPTWDVLITGFEY